MKNLNYAYILYSATWTGNYIYRSQEDAENIARAMNEQEKRVGLKPDIKVKAREVR